MTEPLESYFKMVSLGNNRTCNLCQDSKTYDRKEAKNHILDKHGKKLLYFVYCENCSTDDNQLYEITVCRHCHGTNLMFDYEVIEQ